MNNINITTSLEDIYNLKFIKLTIWNTSDILFLIFHVINFKLKYLLTLKQFLIIFHTETCIFNSTWKKKKETSLYIKYKTDTIFVEEFFNCSIIASDSTLSSSLYRHPLHPHLHHPSKCKCHSLSSTPWGRSAAFPTEANAPLCRLLCLVATFWHREI